MKNNTLSNNKGLFINLISNILAYGFFLGINFFLSPYIVRVLGVEANGFISLANNFVTYASLAAIALNSMAGRFISIKVHQNNNDAAIEYYTSVSIGNQALSILLLIPVIAIILFLDKIISIPPQLIGDVKLLFGLAFLGFLISTAFSSWGTAFFITNRIYIESFRNMQSQVIRGIIIFVLFLMFMPSVYYIGVASIVSTIYITIYSLYYKRKLLPELKISRKYFNFKALFELITSGIWNTIIRAGQILLSGLDLLIANVFIGSTEMGVLALAKTLPNFIIHLINRITYVFMPTLTIKYAKNDIQGLKDELKKGMKITIVIITVFLSLLIIFGYEFYQLWVPSQDARILQILSLLNSFGFIFTSGIQCLYNIFSIVNKLKTSSILILLSGAITTSTVFALLKLTDLGIFAVAGVSSFINVFLNIIFTIPFSAKYLKLKWSTFYSEVFYSFISVAILVTIGYAIKLLFIIDSWYMLIVASMLTAILGFIINIFVVLNKNERGYLLSIVMKKLRNKECKS